jgi:hypothetical protein
MIVEYLVDVDTRRFDNAGAVADEIDRVLEEKFNTHRNKVYIHAIVPHTFEGKTVGYVLVVRLSKSKGVGRI